MREVMKEEQYQVASIYLHSYYVRYRFFSVSFSSVLCF